MEIQQTHRLLITTNVVNDLNNSTSVFHVCNHAMGPFAVNVKDKIQADRNERAGAMQQANRAKCGDLNVYRRDFSKIYSNLEKRTPYYNFQPK